MEIIVYYHYQCLYSPNILDIYNQYKLFCRSIPIYIHVLDSSKEFKPGCYIVKLMSVFSITQRPVFQTYQF